MLTTTPSDFGLAHHWLVKMRGGEKVFEQLCLLFPEAIVYTLISHKAGLSETIQRHAVRDSLLRLIPTAKHRYQYLLPLFPFSLQRLNVAREIKLLFTSDASIVKGLNCPNDVPHVCYCHSPPRYLWDLQETYLQQASALKRFVFRGVTPYMREFDYAAAQRVTHFIANSAFVQERIKNYYQRDSVVIHPPVDVDAFRYDQPEQGFYLIVTELVPYKRVDIAVEAFNRLGKPLIVIGDGPEMKTLRQQAKSNIRFLGRQPFAVLKAHYEQCRAFLFPQIEDFGITAVEAQAAGRPVIAFKRGGALETVLDGVTGTFFAEQTTESLAAAVTQFEASGGLMAVACRTNAEQYRPERFRAEIRQFLINHYPHLFRNYSWPL